MKPINSSFIQKRNDIFAEVNVNPNQNSWRFEPDPDTGLVKNIFTNYKIIILVKEHSNAQKGSSLPSAEICT